MADSVNASGTGAVGIGGNVDRSFVNTGSGTINVTLSDGTLISCLCVGVPPYPRVFVGRDSLLADLRLALRVGSPDRSTSCSTRPLTFAIEGQAGVGKTSLATALAYDSAVLQHFSGGVLWASLGQAPNLDDILNRWGDALGVDVTNNTTSEARAARVQQALHGRPFLVVLDDVWSVEPAVLLQRVTGVGCAHVLTTRDGAIAQRFSPKAVCRVDPLPEDEAVAVLATLCPNAASPSDAGLHRIAQGVGGLPLALVLVGGYLADNVTFADEAQAAFDALAATEVWLGLTDLDRRLSLREVINLSVDALPEVARSAFAALGAFAPRPATFSVVAARSIAGAETPVGLLVRRNLLEKVGEERVALHQVLAAVAVERDLVAGSLREHESQHARYHLGFVNQDRDAWERIDGELAQIRHAWGWLSGPVGDESLILDFVLALHRYHKVRGHWRERIAWCERGLQVAHTSSQREIEALLLNDIGMMYGNMGDGRKALGYYEQALLIVRDVGDRAVEAVTLSNIGGAYDALGEWRTALKYYGQALPIIREEDANAGGATTLNNIGLVYDHLGDSRTALEYYEETLPIRRDVGDRRGEATTLANIGLAYANMGEGWKALEYFELATSLLRNLGDYAGEATTLNNIGLVHARLGDSRTALKCYEEAMPIHRALGNRLGEAVSLNNIGLVYANLGDKRKALEYYEQALPMVREGGNRAGEATTLTNIGELYLNLGEGRKALEYLEQALPISRDVGNRADEAVTLANIGLVYANLGDGRNALEYFTQVLTIYRDMGNQAGQAVTLSHIGLVYGNLGDGRTSLGYYEQALPIFRDVGDRAAEAVTLANIGMILWGKGELSNAVKLLEQAVAIQESTEHSDLERLRSLLERARAALQSSGH